MKKLDDAFEEYRKVHFGAYAPYPIEAYTYFASGWKAAMEAACEVANGKKSRRDVAAELAR